MLPTRPDACIWSCAQPPIGDVVARFKSEGVNAPPDGLMRSVSRKRTRYPEQDPARVDAGISPKCGRSSRGRASATTRSRIDTSQPEYYRFTQWLSCVLREDCVASGRP